MIRPGAASGLIGITPLLSWFSHFPAWYLSLSRNLLNKPDAILTIPGTGLSCVTVSLLCVHAHPRPTLYTQTAAVHYPGRQAVTAHVRCLLQTHPSSAGSRHPDGVWMSLKNKTPLKDKISKCYVDEDTKDCATTHRYVNIKIVQLHNKSNFLLWSWNCDTSLVKKNLAIQESVQY